MRYDKAKSRTPNTVPATISPLPAAVRKASSSAHVNTGQVRCQGTSIKAAVPTVVVEEDCACGMQAAGLEHRGVLDLGHVLDRECRQGHRAGILGVHSELHGLAAHVAEPIHSATTVVLCAEKMRV